MVVHYINLWLQPLPPHGRCPCPSSRADIFVPGFPCRPSSPDGRLVHRSHAILSENVPQFVGARASRSSDVGSEMGPVRPDSPYADAGPAEEAGDQEHIAGKHGPAKRRKKTAAQHSRGGGSCVVLGAEGKTFNILPGPWPLLDTMVKTTRATKFTPPVDCASVAANDQEFDGLLQTWGGLSQIGSRLCVGATK